MVKPEISDRAKNFEFSPIRGLVPYAREARERGTKVYHLNIGQPDLESPLPMHQAVLQFVAGLLEPPQPNQYAPSEGIPELCDAITKYHNTKFSVDVSQKDVIVTTGGSEALLIAMMVTASAGEKIIVPEPFYANYSMFAKALEIELVPFTTHFENGFALGSSPEEVRDGLEKLITETENVKGILFSNPGNPTGNVYSREELGVIASLSQRYGLHVIADEVYNEITFEDEHVPILSIPGMKDHAIVIDSVSKRYSSCGARVGALISKNEEVIEATLKYAQSRLAVATIEQHGSVPAYTHGYVPTEEYKARRDTAMEVFAGQEGIKFNVPKGAMYMVVKFDGMDDTYKFAQYLLEDFNNNNETVMVAPNSGFYITPDMGKDEVRLAFVLNNGEMKRSCELLVMGYNQYMEKLRLQGSGAAHQAPAAD